MAIDDQNLPHCKKPKRMWMEQFRELVTCSVSVPLLYYQLFQLQETFSASKKILLDFLALLANCIGFKTL